MLFENLDDCVAYSDTAKNWLDELFLTLQTNYATVLTNGSETTWPAGVVARRLRPR